MITPLDETRRALLADERRLLAELRDWLVRLGVPEEQRQALADSIGQLEEPFLLVVVGEFNAGKSAFINALLGQEVLEEGVTPTTARIGLLRYGEETSREVTAAGLESLTAPAEVLRDIVIVDTPGTNAVLREHEELTRDFIPRADLVLFITSADRPFTESERAFLEAIRAWGKKVVVVVNKVDLLESPEDVERVLAFVREQAQRTLGFAPEVFPVSSRLALRTRLGGDEAALEASGLPAFEDRVTDTLDEAERFRLKLENPLGVGRRVREEAEALVDGRLAVLKDDLDTLEAVEADLAARAVEMERDFQLRLSDVEKVLLDFERRGHAFFEERLRLMRIHELLGKERLRKDFETQVVADLPRQVEKRVEAMVDWMVGAELRQWQDVMERLGGRQAAHVDGMVGRVDDRFEYDRQRLLEAVRAEAQRAVDAYDAPAEARRLAENVRDSVAQTALLQVSAVGLGTLVTMLATTTAMDVTGLVAAGALSVMGLLVLPARRRKARTELAARVATLREKLLSSLTESFGRERDRSQQRVKEAIAPYSRFVRSEGDRLREAEAALASLEDRLEAVSGRVSGLGESPPPDPEHG
ncbi:MAG: dynamin family protein [Acidobacteria bacterium]|jgi:small GTP-binding protein|nr:dynamin family protein [Acidobacteriota bacterium]